MGAAAVFGTSFEAILPMTDNLTMTSSQAFYNLVVAQSSLGSGKTLTLPAISAMVGAQNLRIKITNKSSNTATIAAASGDSIVGATTLGVSSATVNPGLSFEHDGLHTWYVF